MESSSRVLTPWTWKALISGIKKRQLLVLPFNFQITYDSDSKEFTVEVNPRVKSTVSKNLVLLLDDAEIFSDIQFELF